PGRESATNRNLPAAYGGGLTWAPGSSGAAAHPPTDKAPASATPPAPGRSAGNGREESPLAEKQTDHETWPPFQTGKCAAPDVEYDGVGAGWPRRVRRPAEDKDPSPARRPCPTHRTRAGRRRVTRRHAHRRRPAGTRPRR